MSFPVCLDLSPALNCSSKVRAGWELCIIAGVQHCPLSKDCTDPEDAEVPSLGLGRRSPPPAQLPPGAFGIKANGRAQVSPQKEISC